MIVTKSDIDTVTKGTGTVYNILGSAGPKRYDMITKTPECLAVLNATLATQPTYSVFKVGYIHISYYARKVVEFFK